METDEKAEYAEMSNQRPTSQPLTNPSTHLIGGPPAQPQIGVPAASKPADVNAGPPTGPPHPPVSGPEQHPPLVYAPPSQPHPQGYPVQHGYLPQGPPHPQGYPPQGYPYGNQGGPPPHQGYPSYPPYHHPGPYHEPYIGGPPSMPHGNLPPPPGAVPAPPGPHPGVQGEMPPGRNFFDLVHVLSLYFNCGILDAF
jgi:hypothetical protein